MPLRSLIQFFSKKLGPAELPEGRIDPTKRSHAEFLSRIQGNIIKSHGRAHSAFVFFELGPEIDASQWRAYAGKRVTSALSQSQQAKRAKMPGHTEELFCGFSVTGTGLGKLTPQLSQRALHESLPPAAATRGAVNAIHEGFWNGMAFDAFSLGDQTIGSIGTPPTAWEETFLKPIDGMWTLAHKTKSVLEGSVADLQQALHAMGARQTFVEYGFARSKEPFGFKDNIARSGFLKGTPTGGHWVNLPLSQLFLSDATGIHTGGTFTVIRKLEQNVAAFRAFEQALDALPQVQELKKQFRVKDAGAFVIGRERDGRPLVDQPSSFNFNDPRGGFRSDPQARRCPFHAHIRKANPRGITDGTDDSVLKSTQFVRRSVIYDPEDQLESELPPSTNVGMLFVGHMASIDAQFFHMQVSWMKAPRFPVAPTGPDMMLFADPAGSAALQFDPSAAQIRCPFGASFVQPKGGAYLYSPPIPWFSLI